jgi:hypothetical protein
VQRVVIALALVLGTLLVVTQAAGLLRPAHDITLDASPDCGTSDTMVLMAQSVPSAVSVPCIATLPAGWQFADLHVGRGRTTFSLDSDLAGDDAVEVTFTAPDECDVADAEAVPSDEVGASRYELPRRLTPELRSTRFYRFLGGCVRYDFAFDAGAEPSLVFAANEALAFQARGSLADEVKRQNGLVLCGPADPCPGGDGQ